MKSILVTGCNGFIGRHLTAALLARGFAVRGVDRTERSDAPVDRFEFVNADLTGETAAAGCMNGIDTVIHLAAIPREDRSKTWADFESVNITATRRLLEAAQNAGVKRFVFISTVEAAGFGNGRAPRSEEDTPAPVNNYGKSKLAAELVVREPHWTIERVIIRLPMIYGPGTDLIDAKLFGMVRRRLYPLIGNGSTLMEFCYVENAVHGIILAAEHPAAAGELFYLSDERSYSIREVITAVAGGVGVRILFISLPVPIAYALATLWETAAKLIPVPPLIMPASKKPFFSRETVWWTTHNVNIVSTEKITRMLGYKASVPIDEGCRRTAAWLAARRTTKG